MTTSCAAMTSIAHQTRSDEHRTSILRQILRDGESRGSLRVKTVHRRTHHHHLRIAQKHRRDAVDDDDRGYQADRAESAAHASSRELSDLSGWACRTRGRPPTVAVPIAGAPKPTIIRIVVDFPEPFGPRKPVTMPGFATKLRSSAPRVSLQETGYWDRAGVARRRPHASAVA